MQVNHIVSIRLSILVKDLVVFSSISYDLHNTGEIMIMQMRTKWELFSKRVLKEDLLETLSDPEITEGCRRDFRECSAHIKSKHKHDTQTRQVQGLPERCKTKQNINKKTRQIKSGL